VGDAKVALDLIEHIIRTEGLSAGSRLPTERELTKRSGAGRGAVRRALNILEADNRIIRQVGRGTFLAASAPSGESPGDLAVSPAEIMTARLLLEPELMPLVAATATDLDFGEMQRCLDGGDAADGYSDFESWDAALHRSFAVATHNAMIITLSDALSASRRQPLWGGMKQRSFSPERRDGYRAEHHAIVAALRDRDPEAARHAMRDHLRHVRAHILGDHH
jgi:DNA-binding FadR family transcriptional regulator